MKELLFDLLLAVITAAATAASYLQTAINQLDAEVKAGQTE